MKIIELNTNISCFYYFDNARGIDGKQTDTTIDI